MNYVYKSVGCYCILLYKDIVIEIYVCFFFSVLSVNLYFISFVNWILNFVLNVNDEINGN